MRGSAGHQRRARHPQKLTCMPSGGTEVVTKKKTCWLSVRHFRCSCCVRVIPEHMPVYMRDDFTYCSSSCRDRGLSKIFVNLKLPQLEGRKLPSGGSLAAARNKSSSSLAKTEDTEVTDAEEVERGRLSHLVQIGQRVLAALLRVASKSWGAQVLHEILGLSWPFKWPGAANILFQCAVGSRSGRASLQPATGDGNGSGMCPETRAFASKSVGHPMKSITFSIRLFWPSQDRKDVSMSDMSPRSDGLPSVLSFEE